MPPLVLYSVNRDIIPVTESNPRDHLEVSQMAGVHPLVATALLVCAFHALRQYRRHSFWPLSLFQDPLD